MGYYRKMVRCASANLALYQKRRDEREARMLDSICLLYTSDAADDLLCVDLGGRRIIKKKKKKKHNQQTLIEHKT